MALNLNIELKEDKIYVNPTGEIDIYTSPKLKSEVLIQMENEVKDIVIDGENLDYIDSTGLGALISIYKVVKKEDKNVYIENIKPNIRKLFDITDLDKIFKIKE